MLRVNEIQTGSSGNCTVIENVMIDCGLSYSKIREELYNVDYLLITHIHGDHLKLNTYKKIRKYFPNITTISNWQVAERCSGDIDYVVNYGESEQIGEYTFHVFEALHDVVNNAYWWTAKDEEGNEFDVVFITDTCDFSSMPDRKFDYLFLESNYDEQVVNALKNPRKTYGYDVKKNCKRHASTAAARGCYYLHRRNKESKLIEIHRSSRFFR